MFKRANKVTALLVAAASIMSVVPAMAADTTKLSNKEGTIKQGIAFGNGSYSYYGYRTDDDNTGIWYNNDGGSKDTFNDDLEDYRFTNDSKYGTKYAYAKEDSNDDEYLIDLSTGKIVDDETAEEKADDAKSDLVSKLKKADRYEDLIQHSSDLLSEFDNDADVDQKGTFDQILKGQFGDVWYQYQVTTSGGGYLTGFSDENGKYVDLSEKTNIGVFSTKTGRVEYIKQFDKKDKDSDLTVTLKDVKPIAQDADNIYVLTKVTVTDDYTAAGIVAQPTTQYFVQKVSKAQGGDDNGDCKTAKEITSYFLQETGHEVYNEGDFTAAYEKLVTADSNANNNEKLLGVVAKDNMLYVYSVKTKDTDVDADTNDDKSDKLQVWKLKLGKFKKEVKVGTDLNDDVDVLAVKKDGDTDNGDIVDYDLFSAADIDEDDGLQGLEPIIDSKTNVPVKIAGRQVYRMPSVSIDTKGNVWAVEKGKVHRYTGTDKKTLYTIDRAMNAIDAYDEDNILVWDVSGDVYTSISEGHKKTVDDAIVVDPNLGKVTPATVGWKQEATGWTFYDVNGTKTANYWVNDNGTWYYIKPDGNMATGWAQWNGAWYYLNASGAMQTGWINDGGTWYYCNASGAMLANTTVDGYKLGPSGAWIK